MVGSCALLLVVNCDAIDNRQSSARYIVMKIIIVWMQQPHTHYTRLIVLLFALIFVVVAATNCMHEYERSPVEWRRLSGWPTALSVQVHKVWIVDLFCVFYVATVTTHFSDVEMLCYVLGYFVYEVRGMRNAHVNGTAPPPNETCSHFDWYRDHPLEG